MANHSPYDVLLSATIPEKESAPASGAAEEKHPVGQTIQPEHQVSNRGAMPENWAHFDLILGLGEDLLPVVCNREAEISPNSKITEKGKTPSEYNGQRQIRGINGWTERVVTELDIRRWAREGDYGICVRTHNVRGLDVDITDQALARQVREFIRTKLGFSLPCRYRANSSKFLHPFRLEGEYGKRVIHAKGENKIEFLMNGQQFVAVGTHPSGMRYEWEGGLPFDIPTLSRRQFEDLFQGLQQQFGTKEPRIANSVRRVKSEHLDIADPVVAHLDSRALILGENRDGGLIVPCPWENEHTMGSTGDGRTVYYPAGTNGRPTAGFKCMHGHCEGRKLRQYLDAIGYIEDVAGDFDVIADEATEKFRFQVVPAGEFSRAQAPGWIIKGVLPRAELVVLFGESGSGKSFLALDMGAAIARGIAWRGNRTKQGRVVYIAAEGGGGFRNRLHAYELHHKISLDNLPFGIIHATPNFLQKADAVDVAKAIAAGGLADVVIVDTFAQVIPGANENAAEDIGKALAHCRGIHIATGAVVILVHHAGKDPTRGARGWSGLRAAADAEIEVLRMPTGRMARISKQKDGDDGREWGFDLETVPIGMDEDGDIITSCVIKETEVPLTGKVGSQGRRPLGKWERLVQDVVGEFAVGQNAGIEVDQVIAEVLRRVPPEDGKRDTRKQHARRALLALCDGDDAPYFLEDDCLAVL